MGRVGVSVAYNQMGVCVCVCFLAPTGLVVESAANNQGGVLVCLWHIKTVACVCVCVCVRVSVPYGQGGAFLSICLWDAHRGRPMCSPDAANAGVIYSNPLLMGHVYVSV